MIVNVIGPALVQGIGIQTSETQKKYLAYGKLAYVREKVHMHIAHMYTLWFSEAIM